MLPHRRLAGETARRGLLEGAIGLSSSYSSIASPTDLEQGLTTGFPVRHLGRHLFARHLARGVSYGLLVKALGLFLLGTARRPDPLAIRSVVGLEEGLEEVQRDGQDDGGVLLRGDLAHRLEEPELQCRRALEPVRRLPEAL